MCSGRGWSAGDMSGPQHPSSPALGIHMFKTVAEACPGKEWGGGHSFCFPPSVADRGTSTLKEPHSNSLQCGVQILGHPAALWELKRRYRVNFIGLGGVGGGPSPVTHKRTKAGHIKEGSLLVAQGELCPVGPVIHHHSTSERVTKGGEPVQGSTEQDHATAGARQLRPMAAQTKPNQTLCPSRQLGPL